MMQDVVIRIYSAQYGDTQGSDCVEFTTDGLYTYDGENACLSYLETEVTGLVGTRTSLMLMPDKVVVDRDGMISSRMVFQEGLKNSFQYGTPYGMATLSIDTRRIEKSFDENGGTLAIDYVVDVEHAIISRNIFNLTVMRQPPMPTVDMNPHSENEN